MTEGCGHEVAPGARFCGTCGAPAVTTTGDGPASEGINPSTPWPSGPRRGVREVSLDKAPTVAIGRTTPLPPAPPLPSQVPPPVPPPGGPAPPPPSTSGLDRRTPLILGVLVLVLVAAVLALSFKILSASDDEEDPDPVVARTSTEPGTTEGTTRSEPDPSPSSPASTAPASSASTPVVPVPSSAPTTTAPPTTAPPVTTPPVTSDEAVTALDGYISALDAGDVDGAYSYVAPSLRAQDGWDRDSFTTFWTESVFGAQVVSIDSRSAGTVRATIDYLLPDGATSREQIVATFVDAGGFPAMADYEVLDTERIG